MEMDKPVSFLDLVDLTQEEIVVLLPSFCVYLLWSTKVTSFAGDDLMQDGVQAIRREIVLLGSDLSPHKHGMLSLKEEISQLCRNCTLNIF